MQIKFLGHASFEIITNNIVIYIDPYKLKNIDIQKANYILITHDHFDHFNEEDIKKTSDIKTKIILPEYITTKIENEIKISTHETITFDKIRISTIPAYNIGKSFHNNNQGVGYIIDVTEHNKNYTIYHAGDTDVTPEMKTLRGIDYALLPVGGTYTMNPKEAANAIEIIKPKNVIPMHYGKTIGISLEENIEDLEKTCKKNNINLIILKEGEKINKF
ncbi:MBL fold metallo-hydrolase [Candidatus Woesearchaeota archaeon]|nr:MBL fold metallo-hydrolase [Candidatus Woesearchaeota archaeon]